MRLFVLFALLAGAGACNGTPATLAPPALTLQLSFAPLTHAAGPVTVTAAVLHFSALTAVSDRTVSDGRTAIGPLDLAIGDDVTRALAAAPPGTYSLVNAALDRDALVGVEIQGLYAGAPLHAMIVGGPFDVLCPAPVRLDPGTRAQLDLSVDMSSWFDDVDLASALDDLDDMGLVISDDDNQPLAAALLGGVTGSFHLACHRP